MNTPTVLYKSVISTLKKGSRNNGWRSSNRATRFLMEADDKSTGLIKFLRASKKLSSDLLVLSCRNVA